MCCKYKFNKVFLSLLAVVVVMVWGMAVAQAETCTLTDGTVIQNCLQSDANGNILVEFVYPTEREDNKKLELSEIERAKVYFHEVNLNHWSSISVTDTSISSVYALKPAGEYEVFATVFDNSEANQESKPSNKIRVTLTDLPAILDLPKAPFISATITAVTKIVVTP